MNEWTLVCLVPIRLFAVIAFSSLYVLGGRRWKWTRRFLAPALFSATLIVIALLVKFPLWKLSPLLGLPVVLSLGYSNDDGNGWIRRLIYGSLMGGIGLAIGILSGAWVLGIYQFFMALSASLILGLLNPVEAVNEEALISGLSAFTIPFMI